MKKYDKSELRGTIEKITELAYKASSELREIENENKDILKKLEERKSGYSKNITTGISQLYGRIIKKISHVNSGGHSDYSNFLLIECEDGQRVCLIGYSSETIRLPNLSPEQMKETGFYTENEIQRKVDYIEGKAKQDEKERIRRKQEELDRLTKELEGAK